MKVVTLKLGDRLLGSFPASFQEIGQKEPDVVLLKKLLLGNVECVGAYPLALRVGDTLTISVTSSVDPNAN